MLYFFLFFIQLLQIYSHCIIVVFLIKLLIVFVLNHFFYFFKSKFKLNKDTKLDFLKLTLYF